MSISLSQHRSSIATHQNRLNNNFRGNHTRIRLVKRANQSRSTIPDEIRNFGSYINRAINSNQELRREPYQMRMRQCIVAPLLLSLSQIRLNNPLAESASEMTDPVSRNIEQSGHSESGLLNTIWDPISQSLSKADELISKYDPLRFPEASALPAGRVDDERRDKVFSDTIIMPEPDYVQNKSLALPCIEQRANLSYSDVLRQIGHSFTYPISELAQESMVIYYHNNYHRCPTPEESENVRSITAPIDDIATTIVSALPGGNSVAIAQRIIGPLLRMIADGMDNKETNINDFHTIHDQLLALEKGIVDFTLKKSGQATSDREAKFLNSLTLKNSQISAKVNEKYSEVKYDYGHNEFFVELDDKSQKVYYSPESQEWQETYHYIKTPKDNIYFQHNIVNKLKGHLDMQKFRVRLNQHGIYTVTNQPSGSSFYAIKIVDKFYRYTPLTEKDISRGGTIRCGNTDIEVSRFDENYFIIDKKNKPSIYYSPCRIKRSPTLPCLHLSAGLTNRLDLHKKYGMREDQIPRVVESKTYPGLYESNKGKLYLKYGDNAYFDLIKDPNEVAGSKFMVKGRKKFHNKKIAQVCFSKENGSNYLNTPEENMRESTGISKSEAMSYIEASLGRQKGVSLEDLLPPGVVFKGTEVDPNTLVMSAPYNIGFDIDTELRYLRNKNQYIQLDSEEDGALFIRMSNLDKLYVEYSEQGDKFKPVKVKKHNGMVSSTPHEAVKDLQIHSPTGLELPKKEMLNEAWSLHGMNIKNTNHCSGVSACSSIEVTFKMQYNKLKDKRYIEMPKLEWKEKIKRKDGNNKWKFAADMYDHNPKSITFFPWVNRYIEAYHFAMAKDKKLFNGNVKIYKRNMEPVYANDIKSASTPAQQTKSIQDFLAKKGGVMEITIVDYPQIYKRETTGIQERKVAFDIGFNGKSEAHFNQGIFLGIKSEEHVEKPVEEHVFVTTSDHIELVKGHTNVAAPDDVARPREHHFSPGEVYR